MRVEYWADIHALIGRVTHLMIPAGGVEGKQHLSQYFVPIFGKLTI